MQKTYPHLYADIYEFFDCIGVQILIICSFINQSITQTKSNCNCFVYKSTKKIVTKMLNKKLLIGKMFSDNIIFKTNC